MHCFTCNLTRNLDFVNDKMGGIGLYLQAFGVPIRKTKENSMVGAISGVLRKQEKGQKRASSDRPSTSRGKGVFGYTHTKKADQWSAFSNLPSG